MTGFLSAAAQRLRAELATPAGAAMVGQDDATPGTPGTPAFYIAKGPLRVLNRLTAAEAADVQSGAGAISIGAKIAALLADAKAQGRRLVLPAGVLNIGATQMEWVLAANGAGPIVEGAGSELTTIKSTLTGVGQRALSIRCTSSAQYVHSTVLEGFSILGPSAGQAVGLHMVAHSLPRLSDVLLTRFGTGWQIASGSGAGDQSTTVNMVAQHVRCMFNQELGALFNADAAAALPVANSELIQCKFDGNGQGGLLADNLATVLFKLGSAVANGSLPAHHGGMHFRAVGITTRHVWLESVELGNVCKPYMVKVDAPNNFTTANCRFVNNAGETSAVGIVVGDGVNFAGGYTSERDVVINGNAALAYTQFQIADNANRVELIDPVWSQFTPGVHTKVNTPNLVTRWNEGGKSLRNLGPVVKDWGILPSPLTIDPQADGRMHRVFMGNAAPGVFTINNPAGTPREGDELELMLIHQANVTGIAFGAAWRGPVPAVPAAAQRITARFRYIGGSEARWVNVGGWSAAFA